MRFKNRFFIGLAAALLSSGTFADDVASSWAEPGNTPKLEIRQYRFSRHGKGFDRLVLEFERKDANAAAQPKVTAEKSSTPREWNVNVENAVLLGAIPESLINDSFAKKSRFLGPITVNMDAPQTGFSIRAAAKGGATRVQVLWLENPARLVIDAYGTGGHGLASRETLSINRSKFHPGLGDLMCFPAQAKVGLTVIFKPQANRYEELQNIRINTDGSSPAGTPAADSINCYPRETRVVAALSFETHPKESLISHESPISQPTLAAPVVESDEDLDPGPLTMPTGLGQLPMTGGRAPAEASNVAPAAAAAPAASPLSLLPPLNK